MAAGGAARTSAGPMARPGAARRAFHGAQAHRRVVCGAFEFNGLSGRGEGKRLSSWLAGMAPLKRRKKPQQKNREGMKNPRRAFKKEQLGPQSRRGAPGKF